MSSASPCFACKIGGGEGVERGGDRESATANGHAN